MQRLCGIPDGIPAWARMSRETPLFSIHRDKLVTAIKEFSPKAISVFLSSDGVLSNGKRLEHNCDYDLHNNFLIAVCYAASTPKSQVQWRVLFTVMYVRRQENRDVHVFENTACGEKGTNPQFHNFLNIRSFARRNIVRRAGFRRDRRRANLQRRLLGSAAIVGMHETSTYHLFSTHVYPSTTSIHW